MRRFCWVLSAVAGLHVAVAWAGGEACRLANLSETALSTDAKASAAAVAALREAGPSGLNALLQKYAGLLEKNRAASLNGEAGVANDPQWQRLCAALDAVAKARDTYAARLFWYTDLEQAKVAAKAAGKPILSLRLLGNLDDEYSCANSRFFRTALYANGEVSKYLREHFILHWKSVRPVPRVTIDFGDGRTLERTLTGNSIHYVLDAEGRVIDALPGLYGPAAFLRGLAQAEKVAQATAKVGKGNPVSLVRRYHADQLNAVAAAWVEDLNRLGVALGNETPRALTRNVSNDKAQPTAEEAAPVAISKCAVERPLLSAFASRPERMETATDEATWRRLAALHRADAQLDEASLRFMCAKSALLRQCTLKNSAAADGQKKEADANTSAMTDKFMDAIALDTVRNEYQLHRKIHEWFVRGQAPGDVEKLNERVYAELFLTPDNDPWLGLLPDDVYTALPDDGVAGAPIVAQP